MPAVDVINVKNEKVGRIDLSDDIFNAPIRPHVLTEVVHWQRAQRRAGTQSAKTKAEVHGTTKKPFPQKGRGMARQGSLKNPHQIGGGVAFAPKPRDYGYSMPKTKKRVALAIALSMRLQENGLKILNEMDIADGKTRTANGILKTIGTEKVLVVDGSNEMLNRSMRNLPNAKFLDVAGLNVYDILRYPALVMTERAVASLQARMVPTVEAA